MIPASRAVHCLLLMVAVQILACSDLLAASDPETDLGREAGDRVLSLRDLRFQGMFEQSTSSSCGAAALALVASLCLGTAIPEGDVLAAVEESVRARSAEDAELSAVTAFDLQVAAHSFGVDLRGFRVTCDALWDYFSRGGLPVIVHGTFPHPHFLTVLGTASSVLVVADPSWGWLFLPLDVFTADKGFSGVILVPILADERIAIAREAQAAILTDAGERMKRLRALQVSLP